MDNKSIYLDKNLIESIHTFHKILEIIDHLEENLVELLMKIQCFRIIRMILRN